MNHELLKRLVFDQHEVIRNAQIIPRDYTFDRNANYILTGLRRTGKSTMLFKIVKDLVSDGVAWNQIIYINFEDERLSEFSVMDFNDILSIQAELSDKRGYFFFDEIQNVTGWEKFARRMADAKERVYITGSNAKMLSIEMETTLGGRYLTKHIYPYSFREYLTARGIPHDNEARVQTKASASILQAFDDYLRFGGFPETLAYQEKREYLSSIYQKILLGDIIVRNKVRNATAMKLLMKKLAESVKDELSFTKLHKILKAIGTSISKDIVINYMGYAQEAYLICAINNAFAKFVDKEGTPKYYFADNGILGLFLDDKTPILLENLIAVSLIQRYGNDVHYLKSSKTGIDIDFYLPQEHTAIQVCHVLAETSSNRDMGNLERLSKLMPDVKRLLILTLEDEKTLPTANGAIEVLPVWKWLLEQDA